MELSYSPCTACGRRQRRDFDTDGNGLLVETLVPCGCGASGPQPLRRGRALPAVEIEAHHRKGAGICKDCDAPVDGKVGLALRCAACRKIAAREGRDRWAERNKERLAREQRERYRRVNPTEAACN